MNPERKFLVLLAPVISEKSTLVQQHHQYVFRVARDATKAEIKAAVQELFHVQVKGVQTCNYDGKEKRMGRFVGRRSAWKKAYVCLAAESSIDFGVA